MPPVRLERDGDVAELVLDAPPLNLFGEDVLVALEAAVDECHATRPRALLVRAEGEVFSAGVDVNVFAGLDAEHAAALTTRLLALSHRVEALYEWNVVNRVLPGDELLEKSRRFAARLAAGPTIAHAATKAVVRAQSDHGTRGADDRTAELTSHLFETRDSREAVKSFLQNGPGKADFTSD